MREDNIENRTKKIIEAKKFTSPWKEYKLKNFQDGYVLEKDLEILNESKNKTLRRKVFWDDNEKFKFEYQIPVPINGNFLKAKYLLLYSNPGTEKSEINEKNEIDVKNKEKLLKCFNLDQDAELVIPNEQWFSWYIGELDKFYTDTHKDNKDFDWERFSNDFCFINFFAYPTQENRFNFDENELKEINKLESTRFVKELVKIGIKAEKEVIIIRRSEGVWKHSKKEEDYLFKKLSSSYSKYMLLKTIKKYEKANIHSDSDELNEIRRVFEMIQNKESKAKKYLKKIDLIKK